MRKAEETRGADQSSYGKSHLKLPNGPGVHRLYALGKESGRV